MEKESSRFEQMKERLHLQRLGLYIREGVDCLATSNDTYDHREQQADRLLEQFLADRFGAAEKRKIEDQLVEYISIKEDIAFSLGMKSGAVLMQELIGSFERDGAV